MQKPISLIEFILEEERRFSKARGNLTLLLTQIEYAAKIIASHIKKAGLADILAKTGETNASQDEVIKLDKYSNELLIEILSSSGQVHAIASEELEDIHTVEKHDGQYVVFLDPLDGSSNTEINVTIGTIFSIYHKDKTMLQAGRQQVAAGYILYGTSVMFVYSSGSGVNGFTLDPSIGTFLLSHPDMKIPQAGNIYSINEGNFNLWDKKLKTYIQSLKENKPYKSRYIGSMVADVHRTLLKGGIFLYPQDKKNPEGKLRLLFEVNPLSFIVQQAGGFATSDGINPLDITPIQLHQRVPIAMGSKENIKEYLRFIQ
ncbi:MAG: class 1 fructose-bisphosphatase [Candidatus Levybacteria bacterium]|nr:class 1 fructose-bisphosphatase [Candidatus Levybacteria bacterium]